MSLPYSATVLVNWLPGDLHAVAGVSGEADHRLIDFFGLDARNRRFKSCRHGLLTPSLRGYARVHLDKLLANAPK